MFDMVVFFIVDIIRFVKFVSTPEIIERFVSIERDIMQIESEQANGSINVEGMFDRCIRI